MSDDDETCMLCDNPVIGELVCDECEDEFWNNPEAVLEWFRMCGVETTLEEVKKWQRT